MKSPFVVLIILDGWGMAPDGAGNAISQAETPNIKKFWPSFPHTLLAASGESVGLPAGEVGNTETGHLNLGAGRIVYQDLLRIDHAISEGSFYQNKAITSAISHAKDNNSTLHLMGLVGQGQVHANMEHLYAILTLCRQKNFENVLIHIFTDGRDSPPKAALSYIENLEKFIKQNGTGKIATVMGRYWAMDRDLRWDRTEVAYRALVSGTGLHVKSAKEGVEISYKKGVTDEFINPALVVGSDGKPRTVAADDAVIFYNFRIDRPRQLTTAFVVDNFESEAVREWGFDPYMEKYYKKQLVEIASGKPFDRGPKIENLFFVTMTEYSKPLAKYVQVAYPPEVIKLPLGEVLSSNQARQLRVAESEKERFVTFYFNGQRELAFPGESRVIVPSPKVKTYDKKPEMSASRVAEAIIDGITADNNYKLVVANFANPDMVGHTGNIAAAIKACSVVDKCLGEIVKKVDSLGGTTVITADHGNAEEMLTADGQPETEHSSALVPFIIVGKEFLGKADTLESGVLGDVAPTILKLLDITKPSEMSGRSLI